MPEARRTLVKSPPELWAEVSNADCLGKHLEAFGEIRIIQVEPETTVAWEGDRARGTVELAASGWGTKVTLTAEPVEVEEREPALQQPLAAPAPPEPEAEEPPAEPAPPEPAAEEPPPEPARAEPAPEEPPPPARKRGLFARWFGRREETAVTPRVEERPRVDEPPPVDEEPVAVEEPAPVAEEPDPEPSAPVVEEPAAVEEPPVVASEIRVTRMGDEEAAAVLDGVLDTLGAAHHRPFSR